MPNFNSLPLLFGLFPTLIWLFYYYRKDIHPEPKKYVLKAFLLGALTSLPVFAVQVFISCAIGDKCILLQTQNPIWQNPYAGLLIFMAVSVFSYAYIEEYFKYVVIKDFIITQKYFSEPVDAIMYMIYSALGFATIENILISLGYVRHLNMDASFTSILLFRFFGANLIHVISSGIVGYYLFKALCEHGEFYHKFRHHYFVDVGLGLAALLHFSYNFFIIILSDPKILGVVSSHEKYLFPALFIVIFVGYEVLAHLINKLNHLLLKNAREKTQIVN